MEIVTEPRVESEDEGRLPWLDAVDVCRRHFYLATATFVVVLATTLAAWLLWPRTYASEASLWAPPLPASPPDATALAGWAASDAAEAPRSFNAVCELLHSVAILDRVVDARGVKGVLGPAAGPQSAGRFDALRIFRGKDALTSRERALLVLRGNVRIRPAVDAPVIHVAYRAASPEQAQSILAAYLEAAVQLHRQSERIAVRPETFDEPLAAAERALASAREALASRKDDLGLTSLPGRRAVLDGQIADIERQITEVASELARVEATASALAQALEHTPPTVPRQPQAADASPERTALGEELDQVRAVEERLGAELTPQHPRLAAVRVQRLRLEEAVAAERGAAEASATINPVWQELQSERVAEQAEIAGRQAQRAALAERSAALQAAVAELNGQEQTLGALEQEVERHAAAVRLYAQRREEARLEAAVDAGREPGVRVLQEPTQWSRSVAPQPMLWLGAGCGAAACLALASVAAAEYWDRSFARPDQVRGRLGLPVLASIPRL
jgi:uncharacterized protein involved in exopolysaccharide biosynthesis